MNDAERTELTRAIAESDIAGCSLENADIDALVGVFESWLERRATTVDAEWQTALDDLRDVLEYVRNDTSYAKGLKLVDTISRHLAAAPADAGEAMKKDAQVIERDPECDKCDMGVPMSSYLCTEHPIRTEHPADCTCKGTGHVFRCDFCNPSEALKNCKPDGGEWWD